VTSPLLDRPGVLTNADARAQGISKGVLLARFTPVLHGIHLHRATQIDLLARCAATERLVANVKFSGLTAVEMYGLPLPWGFGRRALPVEVTIPPGPNRPRRAGVAARRQLLTPDDVTQVAGFPVTTPIRTWLDLACRFDEEYLIVVGDAMLRMGLVTASELATATALATGRRGIVVARHALPRLDGRSKSPPESMIRVRIVDRGMPVPTPNADVFDELGCFIATTDLLLKEARIAIEYDGDRHRDEAQFQRDMARDQLLARAGYHVLRAGKRDLRPNATLFFDTLEQLIRDRTPTS
jgi:hypothetical protein